MLAKMKKVIVVSPTVVVSAVIAIASYSSVLGSRAPNIPLPFGSISGFVVDENGRPIVRATVYARQIDQVVHGQMKSVLTDKEGKFFLGAVSPGLNAVHAYKEEDGYPDTFFAVYVTSPAAVPRVMVIEGQEMQVDVQLGPKAIRVALDVSDSDSGEQIQDASVELRQAADPSIYVSLSCRSGNDGRCYVLIPAQPTIVKLIMEGYEDRDITEEISAHLLGSNLKPSETRQMTIRLRRTKRAVP